MDEILDAAAMAVIRNAAQDYAAVLMQRDKLLADIAAARKVAREHGCTWNERESVEGFTRNMVCALESYRKLVEEAK